MIPLNHFAGVLALGLALNSCATAQETPSYTRVICVKVRPGKAVEYEAFLKDVTMKLNKVRVERGYYDRALISEAVYPAGHAAACDYHIVVRFNGFPQEDPTSAQIDEDWKKAGITLTRSAAIAKRDELTTLVSSELWQSRGWVGANPVKGDYVRLNYFKVKSPNWLALENKGWKPLAEAMAKDVPGTGWGIRTLLMPAGSSLPYNAQTLDVFPSWAALGKGLPVMSSWKTVHPDMDITGFFDDLAPTSDLVQTNIIRVADIFTK